ncbi:hypothetical protein [Nocardia jiangxiensis]|uniref:Uncharacterized protein n=1 Tax=Nocardia jiangxiensis TaxID=282685 RepID=A0ABW6S7I2_9NOCA|nr:hypothetical protein [Nocardia jiangxiensis]
MKTGAQYEASLADGRRTFFDGTRVKDSLGDPRTAAAVAEVSAGCERHYTPRQNAVAPYFVFPRSRAELREQLEQMPTWDATAAATAQALQNGPNGGTVPAYLRIDRILGCYLRPPGFVRRTGATWG